jgi:hypothetical protein
MKRVFKTRHFSRWMRKTELTDEALCSAVTEMAQGLIDADLGGGVVKLRSVSGLQVGVSAGALERSSPQTEVADGSSSLASKRMIEPICRR